MLHLNALDLGDCLHVLRCLGPDASMARNAKNLAVIQCRFAAQSVRNAMVVFALTNLQMRVAALTEAFAA